MGVSLFIASISIQVWRVNSYDLRASEVHKSRYGELIYYNKPYCRINTYLIGVLFSFLYLAKSDREKYGFDIFFKIIDKVRTSKLSQLFIYFLSIFSCFAFDAKINFSDHEIKYKLYEKVYIIFSDQF